MTDFHTKVVVFTDLDGTLLDCATYSYAPAEPALGIIAPEENPRCVLLSQNQG